ncbi:MULTISPECIES: hypothetical protein [Blautia]|uniref:hypothetical protein n=1 Tax=Blautia TaxID=572511 RepID=UPI000BA2CAA7|nr:MULTISPECIES: hypothetical protein [Blautia]
MYDLFFFDKEFHTFVTYEFVFLSAIFLVLDYNINIPLSIYFLIMLFAYNREGIEEEDSGRFDTYFLNKYKWLI